MGRGKEVKMYYIENKEGKLSKSYSSYYEALKDKNERFRKGETGMKIKEYITKNESDARREVRTWARINEYKEKLKKNK